MPLIAVLVLALSSAASSPLAKLTPVYKAAKAVAAASDIEGGFGPQTDKALVDLRSAISEAEDNVKAPQEKKCLSEYKEAMDAYLSGSGRRRSGMEMLVKGKSDAMKALDMPGPLEDTKRLSDGVFEAAKKAAGELFSDASRYENAAQTHHKNADRMYLNSPPIVPKKK